MTQSIATSRAGSNYSAADLGALATLDRHTFRPPGLSFEVEGKVFLNSVLDLTSAEISLNKLPPGGGMPFHHHHQTNEEIYVFVGGRGEFQVDGETFDVVEGSVVRVAPQGVRCWRNTSDQPLYYIVVQSPADGYKGKTTIGDGVADAAAVQWPS